MRTGGEPTPLLGSGDSPESSGSSPADAARLPADQTSGPTLDQARQWIAERGATQSAEIRIANRAVEILHDLGLDEPTQIATLLSAVHEGGARQSETFLKRFGSDITQMLNALHRLSKVGDQVVMDVDEDAPAQIETLRRMLLALADDVRVVIAKLGLHLARLESVAVIHSTDALDAQRLGEALGRETLRVQAPLANRLGIWQLKWAMEDLAFRMTEPTAYQAIARQLDETRQAREAFITTTIARIRHLIHGADIEADVAGRPKHLFSIHKKMKAKSLAFDRLMDIRAFRVLVATEAQCYAVLGLLHDHWTPMDSEFDDYITRPKSNGYQSLHTVLLDSEGRPFEVQIRTLEMHQRAELGVAAHWKYKESGAGHASTGDYAGRIAWLRQMLDWGRGALGPVRLGDDRVYALTPKARIIELPSGATPLDFAYHLHTEIGHRCRGAKVDGQMVPLTKPIATGQTVELITVKLGGPSRDWMNPEAGYLKSARARQKVRTWFHALDLAEGRVETKADLKVEAKDLIADRQESLTDAERLRRSEISAEELILSKIAKPRSATKGQVLVVGVDRMLTALARCCKPAPPDVIKGFVTRGRGVSVHRDNCATFMRMAQDAPERVIDTEWGQSSAIEPARYLMDMVLVARSRPDLLRDVAEVLAREKIPMAKLNSFPKGDTMTMVMTLQVIDGAQLERALVLLNDMPGAISARRG